MPEGRDTHEQSRNQEFLRAVADHLKHLGMLDVWRNGDYVAGDLGDSSYHAQSLLIDDEGCSSPVYLIKVFNQNREDESLGRFPVARRAMSADSLEPEDLAYAMVALCRAQDEPIGSPIRWLGLAENDTLLLLAEELLRQHYLVLSVETPPVSEHFSPNGTDGSTKIVISDPSWRLFELSRRTEEDDDKTVVWSLTVVPKLLHGDNVRRETVPFLAGGESWMELVSRGNAGQDYRTSLVRHLVASMSAYSGEALHWVPKWWHIFISEPAPAYLLDYLPLDRKPEPVARLILNARDAELVAAEWMEWLGYGGSAATPVGPDGGVDVLSERAVAQVKMQATPVGRPVLQQLYGVAASLSLDSVFFSSAGYTPQSRDWAEKVRMPLFEFDRQGRPTPSNVWADIVFDAGGY